MLMARPPVQPRPGRATSSPSVVKAILDPTVFRLETSCPECAAPVLFYEEDVSTTCEYCDSLLVLGIAGREPCYYLPTRLTDRDKLVETLGKRTCDLRRRGSNCCSQLLRRQPSNVVAG